MVLEIDNAKNLRSKHDCQNAIKHLPKQKMGFLVDWVGGFEVMHAKR